MSGKVWILFVFDVPDRLGGLLERHRLRPSGKKQTTWWRQFDPDRDYTGERQAAANLLAALKDCGLPFRWRQVERRKPSGPKQTQPAHPVRSQGGFGGKLNATRTRGTWRRKVKRR